MASTSCFKKFEFCTSAVTTLKKPRSFFRAWFFVSRSAKSPSFCERIEIQNQARFSRAVFSYLQHWASRKTEGNPSTVMNKWEYLTASQACLKF
jgi:hypothetical protein